jgi:microcystin-dependent protein
MSDPFMGTVMPVAFQFAPVDWQTCQGQSLQVSQYSALYSLLGNTFGGNGSTSFNLPDLQGRTIVGQGTLNLNGGLTSYVPGTKGGASAVTLTSAQLAAHIHPATATVTPGAGYTAPSLKVAASGAAAGIPSGSNNVLANSADAGGDGVSIYAPAGTATTIPLGGFSAGTPAAAPTVAVNVGPNASTAAPVSILSPYLALYYLIAINGIYPTRP